MDPNANLREQITIARAIEATVDNAPEMGMSDEDRRENEDRGERLAELVLALDEWRRRGGFDPYGHQPNLSPELRDTIRDALQGDSNDDEHDALEAVASEFGIDWEPRL